MFFIVTGGISPSWLCTEVLVVPNRVKLGLPARGAATRQGPPEVSKKWTLYA